MGEDKKQNSGNSVVIAKAVPQTEESVVWETDKGEVRLSVALVKKYFCPEATEVEVITFLSLCKYQKLNPWLREAYLIKYGNYPAAFVVGKDTFAKRAERHPKYRGFKAGIMVQQAETRSGIYRREGALVLGGEKLLGGWCNVFREDREVPIYAEVSLEEYEGRTKEGELNRTWRGKSATMIRKVAFVQAHREAFPEEFEGLYDEAEIHDEERHRPQEFTMPLSTAEAAAKATTGGDGEEQATSPVSVEASPAAILTPPSETVPETSPRQKPSNGKSQRQEAWDLLTKVSKKKQIGAPTLLRELTMTERREGKTSLSELTDAEVVELMGKLRSQI